MIKTSGQGYLDIIPPLQTLAAVIYQLQPSPLVSRTHSSNMENSSLATVSQTGQSLFSMLHKLFTLSLVASLVEQLNFTG